MTSGPRFRPLAEVARNTGVPEATLRYHAQRRPGLAVKRLGQLLVDLDEWERLLRGSPVVEPSSPIQVA